MINIISRSYIADYKLPRSYLKNKKYENVQHVSYRKKLYVLKYKITFFTQ